MRKSLFWTLDHHPESDTTIAEQHAAAHHHAQLADSLGFDCLWLAEHHFFNVGSIPNPSVLLASLAQATQSIRLGPAVAVLPLRETPLIAEDYAMVDIISGGRLNMGVGTGSQQSEFHGMGIEFETRREEFEQRLKKLQAYWSAPTCSGSGSLNLRPIQSPMPPVFVATNTPTRAHQAATEGHSVLTLVSPTADDLSTIQPVLDAHARGLADAKTDTNNAKVVVTVLAHAAETEDEALSTAASSTARFLKVVSGNEIPAPERMCQSMAARNTGLFGTAEQIGKKLDHFHDMGVEHISFLINFGGMSPEQVSNSIRHLAAA